MTSLPQLLLVGNPGGRRTTLLAAACRRAGHRAPQVLSWRTVLADGPSRAGAVLAAALAAPAAPALVRIDSPGDDPVVDRLLRGAPDCAPRGAITAGPAWYRGFSTATAALGDAATAAGARLTADPADLGVLFDKAACHARLEAAGVPVPAALGAPIRGWDDLRDGLRRRGWARVFVKPAHGSSASGVLAVQLRNHRAGADVLARGPVQWHDGRPVNSLRPGTFRGETEVGALVDALAEQRLHVEQWFPKLVLRGKAADVRVLVVAGTATHAVVRTSRGSVTNLHLGNERGDLAALCVVLGDAGWRRVLDVAEASARCFPGMHTVGVDVLVGARAGSSGPAPTPVAVAEVNAFGDLLPNLPGLHRPDHDTYDAQIHSLTGVLTA
ncbi:STM4014 family protein [Rhodococcus sp. HNM0563]|uniref:STM4014 family protein n=1 Tax=Rhodococcus sp. HNM0563 TaxID=2716339 RepID=UPI00146F301E|nr:STM4014 family protein [Rhodococcus sp. HNM0563]